MKRLRSPGQGRGKAVGLVFLVAVVGVTIGTAVRLTVLRQVDRSPAPATLPPFGTAEGDIQAALGHAAGLRVLFVGNSLTYVNDLSRLATRLGIGMKGVTRPVFAVRWTPGGSTLGDALRNPAFRRLLTATRWNVIVLQEGTPLAMVSPGSASQMDADVATLSAQARQRGAIPLLFETWGNRTGTNPEPYPEQQSVLASNYRSAGEKYGIDVAPAGTAWSNALRVNPTRALWGPDGHHPALMGSYLAATLITTCISYALSHHAAASDPTHNGYTAGLDPAIAQSLEGPLGPRPQHPL